MKKMRRVLAFLLTLALCIGMLPTSAFAAGEGYDNYVDEKTSWSQPAQVTTDAE